MSPINLSQFATRSPYNYIIECSLSHTTVLTDKEEGYKHRMLRVRQFYKISYLHDLEGCVCHLEDPRGQYQSYK